MALVRLTNEEILSVVDKLTYLVSTLSRAVHIDDKVDIALPELTQHLGRLLKKVWEKRGIRLYTTL